MSPRTILVGPLSPIHDALSAAALRGAGLSAQAVHPPTDLGLARARAHGNHGQCNPPHYAIGAVLEHACASGLPPQDFAERHAWLTLGSCGPCRLAAFPVEWQQILDGAGLGGLRMEAVDQHGFIEGVAGGAGKRGLGNALINSLIAADALEALGHRLRPWVKDPTALASELEQATARLVGAIESGHGALTVLRETRRRVSELELERDRVLPRVLLVGEPWTTLSRGAPSYDVANRLELLGALVKTPKAIDWLRYLAWQLGRSPRASDAARSSAPRASLRLALRWAVFSRTVGLDEPLEDLDRLSTLATRWYPPEVLGGSSHLELGRALAAAEDRTAHLVLSLKPFGCLPSSALSDGVLGPLLAQTPGAPAFLALETTGDAHATVDSRLEMALQAASLRALDERVRVPAVESRRARAHRLTPRRGP